MGKIGAQFDGEIFRKDHPMVIATNRHTAILLPVRLRYDADGYLAGHVLARNSGDGLFQKYDDGTAASGIDTAVSVLFESHPVDDFVGATGSASVMGVGIFGGCVLYEDKLEGLDANAKTDLGMTSIVDASGTNLVKF